jgi:replicative DNA helicase
MARPEWISRAAEVVPPDWLGTSYGAIYREMLALAYAAQQNGWGPQRFELDKLYQSAHSQGRLESFLKATQNCEVVRAVAEFAASQMLQPESSIQRVVNNLGQTSGRIALFRTAARIQVDALSQPEPAHTLAAAQNAISQITTGIKTPGGGIQQIGDGVLTATAKGFEPSHLPQLSKLLGTFTPGMHVLAARTNVGKSALLGSIALDAAINQHIPTLYLDTEMGSERLLWRCIAWKLGENEHVLRKQFDVNPAVRERVNATHGEIKAAPLFLANVAALSPDQIVCMLNQFRRQYLGEGPGIAIFDYLDAGNTNSNTPEWRLLGQIAKTIRTAAEQYRLPLFCGVQTSRAALSMDHTDFSNAGIGVIGGSRW